MDRSTPLFCQGVQDNGVHDSVSKVINRVSIAVAGLGTARVVSNNVNEQQSVGITVNRHNFIRAVLGNVNRNRIE